MNTSFAKSGEAATPVTDVAPTPLVDTTPAPTQAVAPIQSGSIATGGLVLGDKLPTFEEIVIPRINLVQNIGGMTESFESGELVYDQKLVLYTPPKVNKDGVVVRPGTPGFNMTVLGFRPTRFAEKLKGGARGLLLNSEEAVRKAGGTLDYQEWKLKEKDGMKRFEQLADAVVVIRRPTDQVDGADRIPDDDSSFIFEVEGHKYLLALWAMKGVVYTAAAKKVFFTARQMGCLRKGGYPSWNYNITTREETYPGGNAAWVPKCEAVAPNTASFIDWVKNDILSLK